MSVADETHTEDSPEERRGHTPAEWTTLLISSALILAVVAAVGYFSLTSGNLPPTFRVEPRAMETRGSEGQFYLPVTVTNTGDEPAQDVRVRVNLQSGDTSETAIFTLELLAAGASEEGVVVLTHDPAAGEIRAVVESFL